MRYRGLIAALIGTSALCMTACGTSRQTTKVQDSRFMFHGYETRDSVKEEMVVAVHDTIMETKTITITKNEAGDTTFTSIVTDRLRASNSDRIAAQTTKTVIKTDTVYVAVRDSVSSVTFQGAGNQGGGTALHTTLRWIFWIIIALIVLKICPFFRRE